MSADPIQRIPVAFGTVLKKLRVQRNLTVEALTDTCRFGGDHIVRGFECGDVAPDLTKFFRMADALGISPLFLLVDTVEAWRADPTDTRNGSRRHDFARLFRLGYHHKPGDFRELSTAFYSIPEATHAAGRLNAQRHTRGVALLDTVCVYVRLDYVRLQADGKVTP